LVVRVLAGLVAALAICLNGCGQAPPVGVRIGLATMPANLDPRFATDAASSRLCRLLYVGLTDFDEQARPVPAMATWQRLAPDHYRFYLRAERASYPDGRQPTAADVVATYQSLLDPAIASPHRGTLAHVRAVYATGKAQLDFRLTRPDYLFPGYLTIGVLPADRLAAGHAFERRPWGSGPFAFEAWPSVGELQLRRRSDQILTTFLHVPEPTVRVLKLQRGEIDLLQNDLPPELVGYLAARKHLRVIRRPGTTFAYIGFQFDDPQVGQLTVRQAIGHAIDRRAIVAYLFAGNARPGLSILPPEHWAGAELPELEYAPTRSRQLLRQLGYGPERPLRLDYKTSSDPFRLRIAAALQAQFAEVGIALRVRSYDWGTFFGDVKSGNFQLYSLAWVGVDNPDIFRYVFHSESLPPAGANRGRYRSPAMDRLIARAETASDEAQRIAAFKAVQHQAREDLVYVPLWYEGHVAAFGPRVRRYRLHTRGHYDALTQIELANHR
jgi:peptide/nickel transport system substrate-binding protein